MVAVVVMMRWVDEPPRFGPNARRSTAVAALMVVVVVGLKRKIHVWY